MDDNYIPTVWKEDTLPTTAKNYTNCEVCTPKSRIVWGEGNRNADVVIILDNPGARIDKCGNEFVCGTRQTLQTAIHKVGLNAENFYLTYLLKCRPTRKYDKQKARAFSKPFLINQIQKMNAKYIVCLGDVVVQTMFNDDSASVKNLRGQWHNVINTPCIVSYHPLAVRRRPNLMSVFLYDWRMLAKQLNK